MLIKRDIVVFDAPDLAAESSFWAAVLEGRVEADDDWHTVYVNDEPQLGFQLAPNHVRPQWPDQGDPHAQQQQLHLDLHVDDVRAAHDRVTALGARLLRPAPDLDARQGFQAYADPAGHPFCLCW
jgi:catechol 2,3-dioxygenase-like lactoylglutathione lyase family enzyme